MPARGQRGTARPAVSGSHGLPEQRVRGAILAAPSAHFTEGRLRPEDRAGSGRVGPGLGVVLGHSRELSMTPEGRTAPREAHWVCGVTGSVGVREWSWM